MDRLKPNNYFERIVCPLQVKVKLVSQISVSTLLGNQAKVLLFLIYCTYRLMPYFSEIVVDAFTYL